WPRARATTSGPMPRGSPSVTASRGRLALGPATLEPDIDVREAAQLIEVVFDAELLREIAADPLAHVLVGERPFRLAGRDLDDGELRPRAGAHLHHRLESRARVLRQHLLVLGGELRDVDRLGELLRVLVAVALGERIERQMPGEGAVHRVGPGARGCD